MPILIPPAWALGALLASLYATLFHLWRGESLGDLLRFWIAAWIGFAAGQYASQWMGLAWLQIGSLHVMGASVGAWLALLIARRL
jgi:hypothetical protein